MRINLIIGVGIILIILGIVYFAYHGIPYTSRDNAIDAGSPRISGDTQKTIPMSLLSIGVLIVSGAALVAFGSKNSS